MLSVLSEITSKVGEAADISSAASSPFPRPTPLRPVAPEEVHYVEPFSSIMDEVQTYPEYVLADADPSRTPIPTLYLGSLISTKNKDGLLAHDCRQGGRGRDL